MIKAKFFDCNKNVVGNTKFKYTDFVFDESFFGTGAYGVVSKAQHIATGKTYVIKKVRVTNATALEIQVLSSLHHDNVLPLLDIFFDERQELLCLLMDFIAYDVGHLKSVKNFAVPEIKCLMKQLLLGLNFLHSNGILHRDLKPRNLLMTEDGVLKITDYGLSKHARDCIPGATTPEVITVNYRPPDLVLGNQTYDNKIDMWSVGCIFAEFYLARSEPLFRVEKVDNQVIEVLTEIYSFLGTPQQHKYEPLVKMGGSLTIIKKEHRHKKSLQSNMGSEGWELLNQMLQFDPEKRISAQQALESEYFHKAPLPCHPSSIVLDSKTKDNYRQRANKVLERDRALMNAQN